MRRYNTDDSDITFNVCLVGRCRLTPDSLRLDRQRLKLKYDETLSNCAVNFNLRRYSLGKEFQGQARRSHPIPSTPVALQPLMSKTS